MFAIQPFETDETIREPDWQELARCNDGTGSMSELFFSVGRLGRRAVRERQDRRPEAQARPSAQDPSGGRGSAGAVSVSRPAEPPGRGKRHSYALSLRRRSYE